MTTKLSLARLGKNSNTPLPIFPPRYTCLPAGRHLCKISYINVDGVPLPLVPVTPIIGHGHRSKNIFVLEVTVVPAFSAFTISDRYLYTPGLLTNMSYLVRSPKGLSFSSNTVTSASWLFNHGSTSWV